MSLHTIPFTPYGSGAKLGHGRSPQSLPTLPPIAIGVHIKTLFSIPAKLLKKQNPKLVHTSMRAYGFSVIKLMIFWPGYEVLRYVERIPVAGLDDGDLAVATALVFERFVQSALKLEAPPDGALSYAITPNSAYADMGRMSLGAIRHHGKNVFTLELQCKH